MDPRKQIIPVVILFFAFVFNSCKNDLKLNAPYKEIPSIYAVLNPQEKLQVIRINKVFLGEGDANVMAKVADSINYQPGDLTVTLTRFVNGKQVDASPGKRTLFFTESMVTAEPGAFNTNQMVYICSDTLKNVDPTDGKVKAFGEYHLTVTNNKTGNVFTAKANAIDSVSGQQVAQPFRKPFYPYDPGTSPAEYIDYSAQNTSRSISYMPVVTSNPLNDPKIYHTVARFHFYDIFNDGSRQYRYVDYESGNQEITDLKSVGGFKMLVTEFKGKDIFGALGLGLSRMNLDNNNIKGRKMDKVQFFAYAATQEYLDYLKFMAPSFSISQSKPLYSNFDNRAALGIFTFRSRCAVYKEMATIFINEFSSNPNTCKYKFLTVDDLYRGC